MNKPKDATNTTQENLKVESFEVKRVALVKGEKKYTVFADVVLNGITIYGMSVVEGKNGDFLSFPSRKGKDGKYYSICWARLSDEDQKNILAEIEKQLNK